MFRHVVFPLLIAACCTAGVQAEQHWSFRPIQKGAVPRFEDAAARQWVRNSVDAYILERLRENGLQPAPEADRRTLLRRLTFDLTGLPPTPEEIIAFLADPREGAYERVVDRLLASPHYGERWSQHWLDVVRFAESEGFEYDRYLPGLWRYRDYVIASLNSDKPFDQFLTEQLAGDELDPTNREMLIATGFLRLGPVRRNAGNPKVAFSRNEVLTEMTDSVGAVFLGLTIGCARCHDHKFDDFTQEEYYRIQAFLAATHEKNIFLTGKEEQEAWQATTDRLKETIKDLKQQIADASAESRPALEAKLQQAQKSLPQPLPTLCTVADVEAERSSIHVLKRGVPEMKGKLVGPGLPLVLTSSEITTPSLEHMEKPRLQLARWLSQPNHPLTARVFVNRVWHYHFGSGLVETPNDFGFNGGRPSHPHLLDHLANTFIQNGMRLKPLHRLIVTSSTYRQASRSAQREAGHRIDPNNRLLWQFPRRRLSAEEIRDSMLLASGRLNLHQGGRSVIVPVEKELVDLLYDPAQWEVTPDIREHDRRSVYLLAKRNLRLPFGEVFDQPDLQTSCPRRVVSTHSLQALELLNGPTANRLAEAFASRLEREAGSDRSRQVERAFLLVAGRSPSPAEQELALEFLSGQPLREFTLAMFNLNAFLYVD